MQTDKKKKNKRKSEKETEGAMIKGWEKCVDDDRNEIEQI